MVVYALEKPRLEAGLRAGHELPNVNLLSGEVRVLSEPLAQNLYDVVSVALRHAVLRCQHSSPR